MMDRLDGMSMDIEKPERDRLRSLFPQCFQDGKLDIDKLLSICGAYVDDDFEKYAFTWKGKSECFRLAQKRSTGALRPCPEESVDWDTTRNLYLEGDNLEVLKLLQSAYFGSVKMIYIDPPYNTGNDFIYEDNFADPINRYKEVTRQTTKSNPETMGRFHTNWLNMMYPRLRLAANLLRDDGVCFISIDDHELANLRKLCDEVFGEENFLTCITRSTGTPTGGGFDVFVNELDYILVYARQVECVAIRGLAFTEEDARIYNLEDERGAYLIRPLRRTGGEDRREDRPSMFYALMAPDGTEVVPLGPTGYESRWICGREKYEELQENGLIEWKLTDREGEKVWQVYQKFYLENRTKQPGNLWVNIEGNKKATRSVRQLFDGKKVFDFPKPVGVIKNLAALCTSGDDIVMDFFSGSATTAHAVMQLNREDGGSRRFIMVQLPELTEEDSEAYRAGYKNICEIGKERIRRAGAELRESDGQLHMEKAGEPPDVGFRVFKLDTSNLKKWNSSPVSEEEAQFTLPERFAEMADRVRPDRTDFDLVCEIVLRLGIPLTENIRILEYDGKKVYGVRRLLICLQEGITGETVEKMAEDMPDGMVFGPKCFAGMTELSNVKLILRDRNINMKLI